MIKSVMKVLLLSLMVLMTGCTVIAPKKEEQTLTLSVAASLTECMEEMAQSFNKLYPDIHLQFNFGASGTLEQQIEQGAPVDIFLSAGVKQMNALEKKGLLQDESIPLLRNRLVLITPSTAHLSLSFKDLNGDAVKKIAIGESGSVPAGTYAMQILENLNLANPLKSKLVYAKDVREVLSWIETASVEAGMVYETDAKLSDKVVIQQVADETLHDPIIYPIGVIKGTKHPESVTAFLDYLQSEEANMIFESYGFTPITE